MEVAKTVTLNLLEPTATKQERLLELEETYKQALVWVVGQGVKGRRIGLQNRFYDTIRKSGLHSQIANDLFKDAVAILNNGGIVKRVSIPYNIPRSGAFKETEAGNPVVSVAVLGARIAIPVAQDGAYSRLQETLEHGYTCTFFKLLHRNGQWIVHATLKKDYPIRGGYDAVLGVDMGVRTLATVSIISKEGNVKKQLYFGRDVGNQQRDTSLRRSKLRHHADMGSRYAIQALRRLRRNEQNYTTTRCWQVAHEIVVLAERYNAFISIEDLKNLSKLRCNKKGNRKAKRMPYYRFRVALESVAGQAGRLLVAVYPRGTSHTCSRCEAKGTRNKAIFKCHNCGNIVNADRNASVNIALRAGMSHPNTVGFFSTKIPGRNLPVNTGALVHDGIGIRCLQHHISSPRHAPDFSPE